MRLSFGSHPKQCSLFLTAILPSQCNQDRPSCSRCTRLHITCVGSGQRRFVFKEHFLTPSCTVKLRSANGCNSPAGDAPGGEAACLCSSPQVCPGHTVKVQRKSSSEADAATDTVAVFDTCAQPTVSDQSKPTCRGSLRHADSSRALLPRAVSPTLGAISSQISDLVGSRESAEFVHFGKRSRAGMLHA